LVTINSLALPLATVGSMLAGAVTNT
jgi:hypothetical protein